MVGWWCPNFAAGTVSLSYWAASFGAGAENVEQIVTGRGLGPVSGFGAMLIRFWCECIKLVAVGYLYSYFWVASTAIYFLLRRDVDATETDEVYLDENDGAPEYGLPSLKTDKQGAPEVDEPAAEEDKDDE